MGCHQLVHVHSAFGGVHGLYLCCVRSSQIVLGHLVDRLPGRAHVRHDLRLVRRCGWSSQRRLAWSSCAATRPGIGTNNKVVLGTTESTCVAYVGPAAARTQRSVSYASDGDFFIAYGLPTAHSKTHVDCPREVRNLRKVIDNGGFLWVHESSRTSAPVGCRSSRRG